MARPYKRVDQKIVGVVPEVGQGGTVHVDRYKVPCTVVEVGTTDRRAPMVGVQMDAVVRGGQEREIVRDPRGEVMLFTWRVRTQEWRAYGQGFKTGARLELGVRRGMGVEVEDENVRVVGRPVDTIADRLARLKKD